MKYKVALVYCFFDDSLWQTVLKLNSEVEYDCIDLSENNWLERCLSQSYKLFLVKAPGTTTSVKQMFDERLIILSEVLKKQIYPSLQEILIFENKRFLSHWLLSKEIPSPQTHVFYSKIQAVQFAQKAEYPMVGKINIGASGKGVLILHNLSEALGYINKIFKRGIRPYIGPNFRASSLVAKIKNMLNNKGLLSTKLRTYRSIYIEPQRFALLQEYIKHQYEWRVVVIGNSFFAHKKIVSGIKASGSLIKNYDDPPLSLLDFIYDVCVKAELTSTSIDVFETPEGYLINEIQTFFGQSDPIQMKVGGISGRYLKIDNSWKFEEGDWAVHECYQLRLTHALSLIK